MKILASLSLLAGLATMPAAAAVDVQAASGDWSKLPQLSQRGYEHLSEKMQAKLYEIAASQQCPAFKLVQDRLDVRWSFAVQYAADGALQKIVIPKLDCGEAESVAGGALLEMLQAGDYKPSGKSGNGWYQGTLGFSFAGKSATEAAVSTVKKKQLATTQQGAVTALDPNEVVCEKVEEIGTRLVTKRTCMTRAQWTEEKRLNRDLIDRLQTQRPCNETMC